LRKLKGWGYTPEMIVCERGSRGLELKGESKGDKNTLRGEQKRSGEKEK